MMAKAETPTLVVFIMRRSIERDRYLSGRGI